MSTVGSKNRTVPLEPRIPQQQGPRLQNGGHQKGHKNRAPSADLTEMVVVAIDATKEVTKHALEWALSNVVQPGDYITLLAILPATASGRKLWSFPKLGGDCAAGLRSQGAQLEDEINEACTFMMQQLHKLCDAKKVHVRVKVVPGAARGAIALEAQQLGATWVVLDRHLKKEGKVCMDQLQCNLVIVKRLNPKILRLNLKRSSKIAGGLPFEDGSMDSSSVLLEGLSYIGVPKGFEQSLGQTGMAGVGFLNSDRDTPLSSPEMGTPFTTTEIGTSSNSSSEPSNSPYPDAVYANSELETADARLTDILSSTTPDTLERPRGYPTSESDNDDSSPSGPLGRDLEPIFSDKKPSFLQTETTHISGPRVKSRMPSKSLGESPKMDDKIVSSFRKASPGISGKRISTDSKFSSSFREGGSAQTLRSIMSPASDSPSLKRAVPNDRQMLSDLFNSLKGAVEERQKLGQPTRAGQQRRDESQGKPHQDGLADSFKPKQGDLERTSSVRKAMSLSRHAPPGPPPLCSICQHKAPVFGKPPKRFSFAELELATGGFSQANFLAEGGFGSVHRGVLPDGQAVAVKQHKLASSQGDMEFCSEVEVLSCAQHRNVVMLIGYCVEDRRRLLVYEFVCNRSLDSHLYGKNGNTLEWASRQKIAVGAARGLRYLHEECRVGCIVHRDMRPNNILLTHDFEPMVGDFGLARWQPDGDCAVDTRVIGTFGYLAPEYAQSGQITEKADVYSFGVVLLELVSGRKAVDINRPKGQQCLTEWARPLLEERASNELVDPRLENRFADYEVYCMLHAASLCIRRDAHLRPRMSQVLRILEGDMMVDANGSPSIGRSYDPMSASGRFVTESRFVADMYTYSGKISNHSTESSISLSGPISPPHSLMGFSGGKFANDPLSGQHGKLSHEALKAAYRDKGSLSARLSIEALR